MGPPWLEQGPSPCTCSSPHPYSWEAWWWARAGGPSWSCGWDPQSANQSNPGTPQRIRCGSSKVPSAAPDPGHFSDPPAAPEPKPEIPTCSSSFNGGFLRWGFLTIDAQIWITWFWKGRERRREMVIGVLLFLFLFVLGQIGLFLKCSYCVVEVLDVKFHNTKYLFWQMLLYFLLWLWRPDDTVFFISVPWVLGPWTPTSIHKLLVFWDFL